MCLITKQAKPKQKWFRPIKCYKVIYKDEDFYRTLFVQTVIGEWEKDLHGYIYNAKGPQRINNWDHGFNIDIGYIHMYTSWFKAFAVAKDATRYIPTEIEVWECEIPRFTDYFEGIGYDICARKIKFIKPIQTFEYDE